MIAAALGLGAYYVRALLVPGWTGALARLAEFVLGHLGAGRGLRAARAGQAARGGAAGARLRARRARRRLLGPRPRAARAEEHEFPAVRPSRAMLAVAVVRRRRWSSRTGPSRPRRPSTPACTTRTPPGTTCPSRAGSRRPARSGRSTSPTRSSSPPGSTRRTPSCCTRSGWSRWTPTCSRRWSTWAGWRCRCWRPGASGGPTPSAPRPCSARRSSSTPRCWSARRPATRPTTSPGSSSCSP